MAKPILVVRVGYFFTRKELDIIVEKFLEKITDYHVVLIQKEGADVEFEVYNGSEDNNLDFEELKKIYKKHETLTFKM